MNDEAKPTRDQYGRPIFEWIGDYMLQLSTDGRWEVSQIIWGGRQSRSAVCTTLEAARESASELIFQDSIRERRNYLHILEMRMARSIVHPPDNNLRLKTPAEMRQYCLDRYGRYP